MIYNQKYNFNSNKINFGYIYEENINSEITLNNIIDSVVNNIIIYDTNNYILDDFLISAQALLNDTNKLVIGLIRDSDLKDFKNKGIKGGFFRTTKVDASLAIIIVDKDKFYFAFDKNHIYETKDTEKFKIYNYINHLIWSKTEFEFCQGNFSEVKNTRLSIIKPSFNETNYNDSYDMGTKDFTATIEISKKEIISEKDIVVVNNCTDKAFVNNDVLYLNIFEDGFYSITNWNSLIKAKSFKNESLAKLSNHQLWVNGKIINIKNNDCIVKKYELPLDEYKSFEPDFDMIAAKYNDYTLTLDVKVEVLPIKLNDTYKLSINYSKFDDLNSKLNKSLNELEQLIDEKSRKKQLNSIINERNLSEKVRLYNLFINELDLGVESLNITNKFKELKYDNSCAVPSDFIGKLYVKGNDNYFALTDESKIDVAKSWLKENDLKAVLILA